MSWISGLVDKAEIILDKLDQNAASALQNQSNSSGKAVIHSFQSAEVLNSVPNSAHLMRFSHIGIDPSYNKETNKSFGSIGNSTNTTDKETVSKLEKDELFSSKHLEKYSLKPTPNLVVIDIDGSITKSKEISGALETETDTSNRINSKEIELAVNQEPKAFKIALTEVTCEADDDLNRQIQNFTQQDNISFEKRFKEMELLVQTLTNERSRIRLELVESQSFCNAYLHSISELESKFADSQRKNFELAEKFQMQIKETTQIRQDLDEYRKKAQRALQIKDNLISGLKSDLNRRFNGENNISLNELSETKNDLKNMRKEIESLKEENSFLMQQLENARKDLIDSSNEHTAIISSMICKEDALNKEIRWEKQRSIQLESEQRILSQELTTLRQQLSIQVVRKDAQNESNIKPVTMLRTENKPINEEHEVYNMRIKSLTEALVDKQNCVELITAERNALRLQLEKVQDQVREISLKGNNSFNRGQRNMFSNTTDDVKAQFPLLMKETPFDNRVARRVKRVYSSLDSAGIRLGAFLRHYPLMRIGVLIYIGLLHVWVIFVLLSSTPT